MSLADLLRAPNLSGDFLLDLAAKRLRVNIDGTTITRSATGQLQAGLDAMVAATVDPGQDINDNGPVAITSTRLDTGWAVTAGGLGFTGSPDRVRLNAIIHQNAAATTATRANPALIIERSNDAGGAWTAVSPWSASAYIRESGGHDESSNTIAFVDPAPGTNPVYRLVSRQESGSAAVVAVTSGAFSAEAVG